VEEDEEEDEEEEEFVEAGDSPLWKRTGSRVESLGLSFSSGKRSSGSWMR
jgi:hypothetical protein